ncbi:hypothetical protein D6C91_05676, partial [Aureobasidium pullulans]
SVKADSRWVDSRLERRSRRGFPWNGVSRRVVRRVCTWVESDHFPHSPIDFFRSCDDPTRGFHCLCRTVPQSPTPYFLGSCNQTYTFHSVWCKYIYRCIRCQGCTQQQYSPNHRNRCTDYVKTIVDTTKGDAVFDYRDSADEMISKIKKHLEAGNCGPVLHGLDPVIGKSSEKVLNEIVTPEGAINLVMPSDANITSVGVVHNTDNGSHGADARDLGLVTARWLTKAMQAGTFKGRPFEVGPGGLHAVDQALKDLKDGKNSATKYVFRIEDTRAS